tara:strand:+ start:171 stop:464 length:294 start_codon:yes stop_codon:yes gene_type:complete
METTTYVDFDRIRKHGGYVYFWRLLDRLTPNDKGTLSSKSYYQGDCKLFRFKYLSISIYKEPMGKGTSENFTYNDEDWKYPIPDSIIEIILNAVCNH